MGQPGLFFVGQIPNFKELGSLAVEKPLQVLLEPQLLISSKKK